MIRMVSFLDVLGATQSTLEGVTLDVAKPIHADSFPNYQSFIGNTTENRGDISLSEDISLGWTMLKWRPARGIEKCECPSQYKSSSCQNPGNGYYRWYKVLYDSLNISLQIKASLYHIDNFFYLQICNYRSITLRVKPS